MSKETFEEFMQDHLPEMKTVNERRYFRYIWNHQQKKIDNIKKDMNELGNEFKMVKDAALMTIRDYSSQPSL